MDESSVHNDFLAESGVGPGDDDEEEDEAVAVAAGRLDVESELAAAEVVV